MENGLFLVILWTSGIWMAVTSAEVRDETFSSVPEAAFGEKTFLPEIVPKFVKRTFTATGDLGVSVDLLYSEDALINWVTNGVGNTSLGEERLSLSANQTVPRSYTLEITVPKELLRNIEPFPAENNIDSDDTVVGADDEDFLLDENELLIKFQTLTLSEAAVLKISLDVDDLVDGETLNNIFTDADENVSDSYEGDSPHFPAMIELQQDSFTVTPGQRTLVQLEISFTEYDRFTVRGLIYNWTCDCLFTTLWSTSFYLGPSEFLKLPGDDSEDVRGLNFDDMVEIVDDNSDETTSVKTLAIDIPTEQDDISAVYTVVGHHDMEASGESFMLESSLEQTFSVMKSDKPRGPFPDDVLQFAGGKLSRQSCTVGSRCVVWCHVLGRYVQSMDLMHKNSTSEFVTLSQKHVDIGAYESFVKAVVDSSDPAFSGTYLCKAESGYASVSKEIDVYFNE